MRLSPFDTAHAGRKPYGGRRGDTRIVVLLFCVFLLGIAASAFWFQFHATRRPGVEVPGENTQGLSQASLAVLKALNLPVEIRYYSILDANSADGALKSFAERTDLLLKAYQRESGGHITLTRYAAPTDSALAAASKDGLRPFDLDKGEGNYLGLALVAGERKESLARLSPEWEAALESDITHALLRLSAPIQTTASTTPPPPAPAVIAEVKSLVPSFASVSREEGERILREAALKDFKAVAAETDAKLKEAQEQLAAAKQGKSDADIRAAMQHLQQVQAEQTSRIQQIAARSRAWIEALHEIKAATSQQGP